MSTMFCLTSFHIRYDFEVGNSIGCVQGSMTLVVQEGEEERDIDSRMNFDNNEVKQAEFGEYVASLHSCNNSTFILQYQVNHMTYSATELLLTTNDRIAFLCITSTWIGAGAHHLGYQSYILRAFCG